MKVRYKNIAEFDKEFLSKITLSNYGDGYEQFFGIYINQRFHKYEEFWQKHIVPLTNRVDPTADISQGVRLRDEISEETEKITMVHYSVFINLIQAYKRLEHPDLSSFEDFYTHLVSACDLAEDFWLKMYLLINECEGTQSKIMHQLTEEEFVDHAKKFYKDKYPTIYDHYHKKGKYGAVKIPDIPDILKEFFDGLNASKQYSEYREFSMGKNSDGIRQYRNKIVHNPQIGKIMVLVPKKEAIRKYDTWRKVFNIPTEEQLRSDFIHPIEQMVIDIVKLETLFNNLWGVILQKMELEPLRSNYLKLQHIEFSDGNDSNGNMAKPHIPPNVQPPIRCLGSATSNYVCFNNIPVSSMTEKDITKKKFQ